MRGRVTALWTTAFIGSTPLGAVDALAAIVGAPSCVIDRRGG
jgi:hypothetical protein